MIKSLSINNISHEFAQNVILQDLSLEIEHGSIHALIGTTGAGKSLLLRLISGLTDLQNGSIETDKQKLSFVFQNNSFLPWLTIEKNLELSTKLKTSEMIMLLRKFNLLDYLKMYPKHLSGGTIQKFNLLRAFLNKSEIVLLDEPFSYLDIIQREDLYNAALDLWKEYRPTILMVTHDIDEALYLSHKISFLSKKEKRIKMTLSIGENQKSLPITNLVEERLKKDYLNNFKILRDLLAEDVR